MTLPEIFQQELLAYTSLGSGLVTASAPPRQIRCEICEVSPLAVRFNKLEMTTDELALATVDELKAVAKDLAGRVTYLLESIGPIEEDDEKCVVQMRSLPPTKQDHKQSYYELLVRRGGSLCLSRYENVAGQGRQPVPTDVTREVLERLVGDLCAAMNAL